MELNIRLPFFLLEYILYIGKAILIFQAKQKIFSEVIIIDIEIKKSSIVKQLFHKLHSKLEDLFFKLIMGIPERFIPSALMEWLDHYSTKRINQLKQQTIKQAWRNMYLQDFVNDVSNRQHN